MVSIFVEYRDHEGVVNAQLTEGAAHVSVDLTPAKANEFAVELTRAIPHAEKERLMEDDDGE